MTYILWSSNFASYLEDYLMEKRCIWDNGSVWLKDRPCKINVGQWPIFHGPLILPYFIVRLKLFLYIKKWHWPGVFVPIRALALVVYRNIFNIYDPLNNFSVIFILAVASVAEWLRTLIFSALNHLSSHRYGFQLSSSHIWDKSSSSCGWSGGFSWGSPVFAPPYDWLGSKSKWME